MDYSLTEIVLNVQRDSICKANVIFMITTYQLLSFYYNFIDLNSLFLRGPRNAKKKKKVFNLI